ncbi:MAG: hypothetical protein K5866_04225 [Treponema sp.]|nr:hypothetical protein [Treponema sp.]
MNIKIIHQPQEKENYIVAVKERNIPTAPLNLQDKNNFLSLMINQFPQIKNVKGKKEIEYGLIHRIDTPTVGLVLIALDQKTYDNLLELQTQNKIRKYYRAICKKVPDNREKLQAFPEIEDLERELQEGLEIKSYFRFYGKGRKEVRPVAQNSSQIALKKVDKKVLYNTEIKLICKEDNQYSFDCKITNGFRHQVRCHLAWLNFPIIGDPLYNCLEKESNQNNQLEFRAYKIDINGIIYTM